MIWLILLIGVIIFAISRRNRPAKSPPLLQTVLETLAPVGNVDATCPYCNKTLEKKPGRKKKCPYCYQYIYVRTRPSDKQQVLVTEVQAEQIEEQWSIVNGTHDAYLAAKRQFAEDKAKLTKQLGREANDIEVRWIQLNREIIVHMRQGNWGLFRNAKFEMGEILRKEGKLSEALKLYLEVCYLDLNGPSNIGGYSDEAELVHEFPPWNPNDTIAELAPGVLSAAFEMGQKMNLDQTATQKVFLACASALHASLKLPLSPSNAWEKIWPALYGDEGNAQLIK